MVNWVEARREMSSLSGSLDGLLLKAYKSRRRAVADRSRIEVIQSNVSSGFESSPVPSPAVGGMTRM
ncbi:hypothetical protein PG984_004273 [Apiospora sp. TS-2023a]